MEEKIMKKMKMFAAFALAAAMIAGCTACGGSSSSSASATAASGTTTSAASAASDSAVAKIKAAGKITMVTNAEFEPFEYKDNDKIVGIDVDIAQKVADKLGVKLEITDIAFDSCVPSVQTGKADFSAAGLSVTEDRLKNVDFTDTYYNASQAIIVKKGSDIKSRTDLNGKTVGVQQGTTGDIYCTNEDGSSDIKVGEVKRYPKGMDAISDMIAGRIDAVVIDNFPAEKYVSKNSDKIQKLDEALTEETYAIAVPKNSDLKETINGVIKELNDSGEMDKIVSQYISAD
jgi:polar amino acid transport system substrate-binding protein